MNNKERWNKVLENAISCFERCESPFSTDELTKMEVTSDECYILSQQIAAAMKLKKRLEKFNPTLHDMLLVEQVIEESKREEEYKKGFGK